jgi:chemotaxis protein methyltransferase CheR
MSESALAVAALAELIRGQTGNLVPPARHGFLAEVAERRARATGMGTPGDYVRALGGGGMPKEWESLIPLVTIKESYFFRAPQQFEVIERQVMPRLLRARAATRRLRIWSAACARGEEPATLAMLLAGVPELAGWDWQILATDLDAEALAGARRGLYGERAVALVPPALLARYCRRRGKLFELVPEVLARIDYGPLNLAAPPFDLPDAEYDLILMRNVLIYFARDLQSQVMAHVATRLSRKGALFLGASETLWQIQDDLEPVDLGSCYCYRHRRERPGGAAEEPGSGRRAAAGAAQQGASASRLAAAEVEDRTATATATGAAMAAATGAAMAAAGSQAPVARKAAGAAGAAVGGPAPAAEPAGEPASAPEILLAAARHLADNRLEAARRAVEEALAADPSEPAGHMLDGFLHDLAGRAEEAVGCYRAALYLDPALFQARVLLADCLLRLGQRARAAHQYREVLAALENGRERSVALFAGLPLPDRERALRRCRQALAAGG